MSTPFSMVVAHDRNRGIGKDGDLVWHLPKDMAYFKKITTTAPEGCQNWVIMGRKTWESIPEKYRPLPGRHNIVLGRTHLHLPKTVTQFHNLEDALTHINARQKEHEEVFIIGGGALYNECITHPKCQKLHITQVDKIFDCDRFFPNYTDTFNATHIGKWIQDKDANIRFCEFQKIAS